MDFITKVYFDPLLSEKEQMRRLLSTLPIGSAHPCCGQLLVHISENVITALDISMHNDGFFINAISLEDLADQTLARMKLFPEQIGVFNEQYRISQAPASTFQVPIIDGLIHIMALSVREPDYYDLCVGDAVCQSCCYDARHTFKGMEHSGDCNAGNVLLQHITLTPELDETSRTVFVSGYHNHALPTYKQHNPLVLVADHSNKTLYIVPVPLDAATIGYDATICCPLVVQKNASSNSLLCSILPTPTIETNVYCSGAVTSSTAFSRAITQGSTLLEHPQPIVQSVPQVPHASKAGHTAFSLKESHVNGRDLIIATNFARINNLYRAQCYTLDPRDTRQSPISYTTSAQIIRFGKGINWISDDQNDLANSDGSTSVLPCILGGTMQGPMLLAIGKPPMGAVVSHTSELHEYYEQSRTIVVLVDENMTDNARNIATTWRLNGLFVLQGNQADTPVDDEDVVSILNSLNVNAITALAGPQSLILAQLGAKYYFYRGIANPDAIDTSALMFGQEITDLVLTHGLRDLAERVHSRSWSRLVDLAKDNPVHLPRSKQMMNLELIRKTFERASIDDLVASKVDITMMIPQLQAILPQDRIFEVCQTLIHLVLEKVDDLTSPLRQEYSTFVVRNFDPTNNESAKKRDKLLSNLKRTRKTVQRNIRWLTEALGHAVSTQTTSSRAHDLKRLARQTIIQGNVAAAKMMTFQKLSEILEEHASQMGVLLVNIRTGPYMRYISESLYLRENCLPSADEPCVLDERILYLDGLDAGIVLEASQHEHSGPLVSDQGPEHPILALPYLNKRLGQDGSMLAWVCWDEFTLLQNPYLVRWIEKCNDSHIAALRILMRNTLSQAASSRDVVKLTPSSRETGELTGALLMAAMRKLAETRSTVPKVSQQQAASSDEADLDAIGTSVDTSTLLMRGMLGNLLTTAGSGTQPISFVWQLFGQNSALEIPASSVAWNWYEHTSRMLPYSGWPLEQYKYNVVRLLDKVIFRMMTKNKKPKRDPTSLAKRIETTQANCKVRNIELRYVRILVTVLERMFSEQSDSEYQASARRLLQAIPGNLGHQTASYTKLHRYVRHLAEGGKQRTHDNLVAANVLTKRSAIFSEGKRNLVQALADKEHDHDKIIEACQTLLATKKAIETRWGLEEGAIHMQNLNCVYQIMDQSSSSKTISPDVIQKIRSDAEVSRTPWQVSYKGHSSKPEEIQQDIVDYVLGNCDRELAIYQPLQEPLDVPNADPSEETVVMRYNLDDDELQRLQGTMELAFLKEVREATSFDTVCQLLGITTGAMEAFVAILSPGDQDEARARLPLMFRQTVLMLQRTRSRDPSIVKPAMMLLDTQS